MQAWRGVPSHFNMSTPFDTVVAQTLAIGGFTLVVVIVLVTIAAFRHGSSLAAPMRTALRAGFLALVASQIAGGIMIATGVRYVIGGDPQRAYEIGGWNRRAQMQAMRVAIAGYVVVIAAAVVVAFRS